MTTVDGPQQGTILGTFQYMAPEQLEGREADARTDIWAFGCVVYEMVSGKKAFEGTSQASLISAIMKDEPRSISALQPMSPPMLDQVIRICLAKDPDERWQSAGDIGRQLKLATDGSATQITPTGATTVSARPTGWRSSLPLAVGALLIGGLIIGLAVWSLTRPGPGSITRFPIVLPQTQQLTNTGRRSIAISPTGTHLVYVANRQLYLRAMDEIEAMPLGGTQGSAPTTPFFSPDGQWTGFYSVADRQLKKIALTGGAAVTLCDADTPYGATWEAGDTIVYGQGAGGIFLVPGDPPLR